ncbi:head completion/stabilization protein [Sphingomonas oligophenolica]|uniref:Head completion/stabilization protein n=1 Tax=Sphingomonas oligophenolica TaxID=301154 RepID=A0A502CNL9_9SPHN|nr:head completion/stabilization protein [Sphingomonas oligophenolica]TPG14352.1 head completion/stabilization protein [Sphingomonas oligophenolica]
MSGLVCTPSIVPGATARTQAVIINDGWLPDIEPDAIALAVRIPAGILAERIRAACIGAILTLAPDLALFAAAQLLGGHASLADVPALQLDGKSRLVLLYERAVGALAKAELIERHRDVDQAGGAQRDASALDMSPDQLRRDATHAIRQILGRSATTVELI